MELPRSNSVTPTEVDFAMQYNDGHNFLSNSLMSESFNVANRSSSYAAYRQGHSPSVLADTIRNGTDAYWDMNTASNAWSNPRESNATSNTPERAKVHNVDTSDSQMGFNLYHREGPIAADSGYQSMSLLNHPCGISDFKTYLDYGEDTALDQEGTDLHSDHRPTVQFDVNSPAVAAKPSSRLEAVPSSEDTRLRELLEYSVKEVEAAASAVNTLVFQFNNDIKNVFQDLTSRLESSNSQWLAGEHLMFTKDLGALEHEMGELRAFMENHSQATAAKDKLIDRLTAILGKERLCQAAHREYGDDHISRYKVFQSHVSDWTYCQHLKRRVFQALRGHVHAGSRTRWEAACKQRAEEVCHQLEEQFEATKVKLDGQIEQLKCEKITLLNEKGEYENTVQQALMRGICSLNMEALKVLKINKIDELNAVGENGDSQASDSPQPVDETTTQPQIAKENPAEGKDSGTEMYDSVSQPVANRCGQRYHSSRYISTTTRPLNHRHHPGASPTKIPRKPTLANNKRRN